MIFRRKIGNPVFFFFHKTGKGYPGGGKQNKRNYNRDLCRYRCNGDFCAGFYAGFYAGFCAVLYCFCVGFYVGTWADLSHGTGCKRNNNLEDITINKLRLSSTV